MPLIESLLPWDGQPQPELNFAHPAVPSLGRIWLPGYRVGLSPSRNADLAAVGSPAVLASAGVTGSTELSSSSYLLDREFNLGSPSSLPFTLLLVVRKTQNALPTSLGIAGKLDFTSSGGSGNGRGFALSTIAADGQAFVLTFRGQRVELQPSFVTPNAEWLVHPNKRYVVALSVNDGSASGSCFIDGRDVSGALNFPGGLSDWDPQATVPVALGAAWDEGTARNAGPAFVLEALGVWPRDRIPDSTLFELSVDPWQLFEPRRIWIAASDPASDTTLAASGNAVVTGTANLTTAIRLAATPSAAVTGAADLTTAVRLAAEGNIIVTGTASFPAAAAPTLSLPTVINITTTSATPRVTITI